MKPRRRKKRKVIRLVMLGLLLITIMGLFAYRACNLIDPIKYPLW